MMPGPVTRLMRVPEAMRFIMLTKIGNRRMRTNVSKDLENL